jgi:hypothetical protein
MQESSAPKLPPVATEMPEQSTSTASGLEIVHEMFPHLDHKTISDALIAAKNDIEITINYLLASDEFGRYFGHVSICPTSY